MEAYEYLVQLRDGQAGTSDLKVMEQALELLARAAPAEEEAWERRKRLLAELARLSLESPHRDETPELAALSIVAGRAACTARPAAGPVHATACTNLALALLASADRGHSAPGEEEALRDEARDWLEEALMALPPDDPDRCAVWLDLAVVIGRRDPAAAVAACRAALAEAPPDSPHRATIESTLASMQRRAGTTDHDAVIAWARAALAALADDHQDRPLAAARVAAALRARAAEAAGPPPEEDLAEAADLLRDAAGALARQPGRRLELAQVVAELAAVLLTLHRTDRNDALLDEAVRRAEEVAALFDDGPVLFPVAANLAACLRERYRRRSSAPDLAAAQSWARRAVATAPGTGRGTATARYNLAVVLLHEYETSGSQDVLDEALHHLAAAQAAAPDDALRAEVQSGLAEAMRRRYVHGGSHRDLARGVLAARRAVRLAGAGPRRTRHLGRLCSLLRTRYDATGRAADLELALTLGRAALAASARGGAPEARTASLVSLALLRTFDRAGDRRQLDEAVALARRSAALTPETATARPSRLHNLANALRVRFEVDREVGDLDEAIGLVRASIAAPSRAAARRELALANLGALLIRRFEAVGDPRDIDRAIAAHGEAANAAGSDGPAYAGHLADLGLALFRRHELTDAPNDLNAAITCGRACLDAAGDASPQLAGFRSNLVGPLLARHRLAGAPEDLTEALALGRLAVDAALPRDPARAGYLLNLARALDRAAEAEPDGGAEDAAEEAVRAYAECADSDTATPLWRAAAAQAQAQCEVRRGDLTAAQAAYERAIALLSQVAHRALARVSAQAQLRRLTGLGADAAAVALRLGDPARAVDLLERSRGVLLGQGLDYRPQSGTATDRLEDFRRVLSTDVAPLADPFGGPLHPLSTADPWAPRRAAARAWQDLAGPEAAGTPARPTAPKGGVVAVVNASRHGCAALLVADDGAVTPVPLPELTHADAVAWANTMLDAVDADDWDTSRKLRAVLAGLWTRVAEPVLDALGAIGPPPPGAAWPRVTWVPTGPLALLPLHAAGADGPDEVGASVLDRVVSSYAPTLRVLAHAADDRTPEQAGSLGAAAGPALAVGVTEVPGERSLPHAAPEAEAVHAHLRAAGRPVRAPLLDAAATRAAVSEALVAASWAHFACHCLTDPADPSASALLLPDGPLSVRDLVQGRLTGAHLAYLSSCRSAYGGARLPDESLHIAAALQLAGFRHVIGTLWPVGDDWSHEVASALYPLLTEPGRTPAEAVHHGVRALRDRYPTNPRLWAAYLHFGV
ncbi:CHAT domain-containing protein [Streptacidiphilus jiangxiensis]|uniref:CHAT domain-containing protein n=1 Tax=Streptacidiphilus jiangxiensis TaxID=235985 RepID=A0A1H7WI95_STRJI|nr:CHAT domain-containing protein [Streptacidiphilus jiangxiensis]SEM21211.1 CHAT domain-containing protein [Streptacidiphilus jiangxiensis]